MQWTDDQKLVIDSRGRNILVAAAAGSGKTAVLVERILTLITDPAHPADIDRLLVVTFTRAAAAQMRERIRTTLEKRLDESPDDPVLTRQLTLLPNARITTIDGFCSYVLRSYGASIGLEGGFRVADEGEMKLLREDTLQKLFEEEHESGRLAFREFMDTFAPGRSTAAPAEMIQKVYDTAFSGPDPDGWLTDCINAPEDIRWENADHVLWMREYLRDMQLLISRGLMLAQQNAELANSPAGPSAYIPAAQESIDLFTALDEAGNDYDRLRNILTSFSPSILSRSKPLPGEDESLRDSFKSTRTSINKIRESLLSDYLRYDAETLLESQRNSIPVLAELVRLVRRFREMFSAAKREKNLLDYNDLEQFALQILVDADGHPTRAAEELGDRYLAVMIDEYQDSNYLQEAVLLAVSRIARGENNYFMVGDVKQSIYSFREARPDLFMKKYDRGSTECDLRIDLRSNFRSRREVIRSVNCIFRQIMRREIGGIDYDDDAALVYGAGEIYPEPAEEGSAAALSDYQTECMLVYPPAADDGSPASARTGMETEAWAIADRIFSLKENTRLYDKDAKVTRPAEYRDIVILLRSMGDFAEILQEVLRIRGIPVYTNRKTGYYTAQEVQAVLQYLAILDNPRQDIPLAAVLRSPFMRLDAREMAMIRSFADRREEMSRASFWDCVRLYAAEGDDISLRDRLDAFLRSWAQYRESARRQPVHELIFRLISETGFADYVRALPGGPIRSGNLEMLITIAAEYEKTSYAGLYHFIRYVNELRKYDIDTGEAVLTGEGGNAVRIMTIHSSKGLEFPIVILGQMHKQFNRTDLNKKVLIHPDCGIASDYLRLADRVQIKTPARQAVRRRLMKDAAGEELRVLYVAMTRAEQKLILTGIVKNGEALDKKRISPDYDEVRLSEAILSSALNFWDFVLPAAMRIAALPGTDPSLFRSSVSLPETAPGEPAPLRFVEIFGNEIRQEVSEKIEKEAALFRIMQTADLSRPFNEALHQLLSERFSFHYPHEGLDRMPAKISVSELKAARYHDEEAFQLFEDPPVIPLIPAFMRDEPETLTGAGRGTVYHKFMELMDYAAVAEDAGAGASSDSTVRGKLKHEISRLTEARHLSEEEASVIRTADIEKFLRSPIGKRMADASARGKLFRETPFTYSVPADTIDPVFPSSETILVQGVIDAWFMEDDHIVLVDYKTDYIASGKKEELLRKYRAQLLTYADALQRLTGRAVTEQYIYSFFFGEEIPVE